jgi:hypothetical protein
VALRLIPAHIRRAAELDLPPVIVTQGLGYPNSPKDR